MQVMMAVVVAAAASHIAVDVALMLHELMVTM
jgi:hypothetical protein